MVSMAVEPFMVRSGFGGQRTQPVHPRQYAFRVVGVLPELLPLAVRQVSVLLQDGARDRNLPQVVHQRRAPELRHVPLSQPHLTADVDSDVCYVPGVVPGARRGDVGEVGHNLAHGVHRLLSGLIERSRRGHLQHSLLYRLLVQYLPELGPLGLLPELVHQLRVEVGASPFAGYGDGRGHAAEAMGDP